MSDGQGGGKRQPPSDDRTLLDPLSNDELKALREARQRMQAKKSGGSAVAHQIVIGPDSGEDIGDAPTRAMPALPSFEGNVSLDQIGTGPHQVVSGAARDPASQPSHAPGGVAPTEPMSMAGGGQTAPMSQASMPNLPGGPRVGQPGFGENTLLWMQPPKPPPSANVGAAGAATGDIIPKASAAEVAKRRLAKVGVALLLVLIVGGLLFVTLTNKERGVIQLHTTPEGAHLLVDGKAYEQTTPVKLTLPEGDHEIEVSLDGYAPHRVTAHVKAGEEAERLDIDLDPISKPGLLTIGIEVQPVAAQIVVDGQTYPGKRTLKIPNLDPKTAHKITIEAGGYVKIEQDIPPEQLKSSYSFVLQRDGDKP